MSSGPSQAEIDARDAQKNAISVVNQNTAAGTQLLGQYNQQNTNLQGALGGFLNDQSKPVQYSSDVAGYLPMLTSLLQGKQTGNDAASSVTRGRTPAAMFGGMTEAALANGLQNDKALTDAAATLDANHVAMMGDLASRGLSTKSGSGASILNQSRNAAGANIANAYAANANNRVQLEQSQQGINNQLDLGLQGLSDQFDLGKAGASVAQQNANTNQNSAQIDAILKALGLDLNRQQAGSGNQLAALQALLGANANTGNMAANFLNPAGAQNIYGTANQNAQANAAGQGSMMGSGIQLLGSVLTSVLPFLL